jgi:hypothetical protein
MPLTFSQLLFLLFLTPTVTFRILHRSHRLKSFEGLSLSSGTVEDGVPLTSLDIDADGKFLYDSLTQYLDDEFIKQEIHGKIAETVVSVYCAERKKGVSDLGDMLVLIGSALESFDMGDAFVGPWDVANKASDLLMFRMGRELCSCTEDLSMFSSTNSSAKPTDAVFMLFDAKSESAIHVSVDEIKSATENLRTEFRRYTFLRNFADGDAPWSDVHPVIALCLGFRTENDSVVQNQILAPQVG